MNPCFLARSSILALQFHHQPPRVKHPHPLLSRNFRASSPLRLPQTSTQFLSFPWRQEDYRKLYRHRERGRPLFVMRLCWVVPTRFSQLHILTGAPSNKGKWTSKTTDHLDHNGECLSLYFWATMWCHGKPLPRCSVYGAFPQYTTQCCHYLPLQLPKSTLECEWTFYTDSLLMLEGMRRGVQDHTFCINCIRG